MSALKISDIENNIGTGVDESSSIAVDMLSKYFEKTNKLEKHNVFGPQSKISLSENDKENLSRDNFLTKYLFEQRQVIEKNVTSKILQKWECVVKSFSDGVILAVAYDLLDSKKPTEEVEIDIECVPEDDRELIATGAVFYWHIGYFRDVKGTIFRGSTFRFRRLPAWTKKEIEDAKSQANELGEMFDLQYNKT